MGWNRRSREILAKLGRKDESLAMAWADFEKHPSDHTYERFMEYVPKVARAEWHMRAMETAAQADIDDFMDICVATGEWEPLASRVLAASDGALEDLSHYTLEPAAEGLAKRNIPAAAKLYRALGFRILTSKKSKYYDAALSHFRRARDLCRKASLDSEWQAVVDRVYAEHSRKYGFMPGFERLLAGKTESNPSFAEKARARWQQQVSDRPDVGPRSHQAMTMQRECTERYGAFWPPAITTWCMRFGRDCGEHDREKLVRGGFGSGGQERMETHSRALPSASAPSFRSRAKGHRAWSMCWVIGPGVGDDCGCRDGPPLPDFAIGYCLWTLAVLPPVAGIRADFIHGIRIGP